MFTDRGGDISRGTISVQLRRAIVRIVRSPSAVFGAFRPIGRLRFFGGGILAVALAPNLGWAQHITIDGRFSPAQSLAAVGGTYSIGANLGKQVGSNLFHSFGQFGLSTGETAAFSGPATISNVIGRVTGGNPSAIDGKIQSNIAGANLYLINPSGIVFGPNATVNVSGSFHASTADYVKMSDGAKFQATNPDGSTLSAAPPAAFGFLNASPAAITVNGSTLGPVPGTLGLVAGPVSVTGPPPARAACAATLCAPGGTIHVTSAAGVGEVPVDPHNTSALTVTSFGPVDIKGGAKLDVSNRSGLGSGGSVFIRSGALTIDASEINGDNYGSGPGGVLSLRGDGQITLSNSANVHAVAMGSGNGASITIVAGQLTLRNGTNVLAQTSGSGSGGDVIVSVGGSLTVDSGASLGTIASAQGNAGDVSIQAGSVTIDMSVGAVASTLDGIGSGTVGKGNAGNVTLTAGALTIKNNGLLSSTTIGAGNSGSVSVNVSGTLSVDGSNGITPLETGISADAGCFQCGPKSGNAAKVTVTAGTLSIANGGTISSSTFSNGDGGNVAVSIADALTIDGTMPPPDFPLPTGIVSQANHGSTGIGGAISVSAGSISIVNSGVISNSTFGPGNSGSVSVNVAGALTIDGTMAPNSFTGISSQTNPKSMGNAGTVSVSAESISIVNGGEISSDTFGSANGGSVLVNVADGLTIMGNGRFTGITTDSEPTSVGNAGFIKVVANELALVNGGEIASRTFGSGMGGQVSVGVSGALTIDGSTATNLTGITAQSEGGGDAGTIKITAGTLSIVNNGVISSATFGTGAGGDVSVNVGGPGSQSGIANFGELSMDGSGVISAETLGAGAGGRVMVSASNRISLDGSDINAGTFQPVGGNAGNLAISAPTLSLTGGARISTRTFGSGNGGTISINIGGALTIAGSSGIAADADSGSTGHAGDVVVDAGTLSLSGGGIISSATAGAGNGGTVSVTVPGQLTIVGSQLGSGISASTLTGSSGNAGNVTVTAGSLSISDDGLISAFTFGSGRGGNVSVDVAGPVMLDGGGIDANADRGSTGNAGSVHVNAAALSIADEGFVASTAFASGNGGNVLVTVNGPLSITSDGVVDSATISSGNGGDVSVAVSGPLSLTNGGHIFSTTSGSGNGGNVAVATAGAVTLTGIGVAGRSGIAASALDGSNGHAGTVSLSGGGGITVETGAEIASTTAGTGAGGSVAVMTPGALVLDGAGVANTQIAASATGPQSGPGGSVSITANALTLKGGAQIASSTAGRGKGGDVMVTVASDVTLSGGGPSSASGITASAQPGSSGQAGEVVLTAGGAITLSGGAKATSSTDGAGNAGTVQVSSQGPLSLSDPGSGIIALASSTASGNAGSVTVTAPRIALTTGAEISSTTAGSGAGGSVNVTTPGMLVLDGAGLPGNTQIAASATGTQSGPGGSVTIAADALAIEGGARIASTTFGPGKAGDIAVTVANDVTLSGTGPTGASGITAAAQVGSSGQAGEVTLIAGGALALSGGAKVTSSTAGRGNGGTVQVTAHGPLSLRDLGSGIIASAISTASGNAGSVMVSAPQIALISGAEIASSTAGTGAGGSVSVTTPGKLALNGNGDPGTQIATSAVGPQSGPGGSVTVTANFLTVEGGAQIASSTAGRGKGGDVEVTIANDVALSGVAPDGTPSGITASARPGSSGPAGEVVLMAGGAIALSGGAQATSSTAGAGNGGTVQVTAQGPLTLSGPGTGIIALATPMASGNAGSVTVGASQIMLTAGGEIASTTAGTGAGGSVSVTTPGALVLNGNGDANTQIAASAIGPQSGPGGSVTVAAHSLTVEGGAQIAGSTAGPGKGGDVNVVVASDVVLPDAGPQITAQSTGSGDAGSITVSANRLLISNGGAISTEARTSTASGGNISLTVRDFLYLTSSEISTSVKGETGNGGNITIDPQLVILDHSSIIAQAVEGHGGNITITADQFIPSSDSIVSASSELGISGTIVINGPRVDVNGALVVLSTQLRSRTEVLRQACAARAGQPVSSLVEAGRGGLPQDPEATLPALYIAGRDVTLSPPAAAGPTEASGALQTTAHLTMRCG